MKTDYPQHIKDEIKRQEAMNLEQFLREKSKSVSKYLNCSQEDIYVQYLMVVDAVLDKVKEGVEKEMFEIKTPETISELQKVISLESILTIIDNIKIK